MRAVSSPFAAIAGAAHRHSTTIHLAMCSSSFTSAGPPRPSRLLGVLLLRRRSQIVELDDRVGLGPDAELAGILERAVVIVDDLLAVEEDLDVVAHHFHREIVPGAGGDL